MALAWPWHGLGMAFAPLTLLNQPSTKPEPSLIDKCKLSYPKVYPA